MTEKRDERVELPLTTGELIAFLPKLYDPRELVQLTLAGKHEEAKKIAAKIEMIDELADIWQEQQEAARKRREVR